MSRAPSCAGPDWNTMKLRDLFSDDAAIEPQAEAVDVKGLCVDSRGVKPDDLITMSPNSSAQQVIRDATDLTASVAPWLQADHDGLTGKILKWPERSEIDTPVQESLIVELYSK